MTRHRAAPSRSNLYTRAAPIYGSTVAIVTTLHSVLQCQFFRSTMGIEGGSEAFSERFGGHDTYGRFCNTLRNDETLQPSENSSPKTSSLVRGSVRGATPDATMRRDRSSRIEYSHLMPTRGSQRCGRCQIFLLDSKRNPRAIYSNSDRRHGCHHYITSTYANQPFIELLVQFTAIVERDLR